MVLTQQDIETIKLLMGAGQNMKTEAIDAGIQVLNATSDKFPIVWERAVQITQQFAILHAIEWIIWFIISSVMGYVCYRKSGSNDGWEFVLGWIITAVILGIFILIINGSLEAIIAPDYTIIKTVFEAATGKALP